MLSGARLGPVLRDRRSAVEMACNFRGRRRISCGLDVVERAAGGPVLRDGRRILRCACHAKQGPAALPTTLSPFR